MEALKILKESLEMLWENPVIFLPKLVSTGMSSVLLVLIVSNFQFLKSLSSYKLLAVALILPLIMTLIGVLASMLVAAMVKHFDDPRIVRKSITEVVERIRQAVKTTLLLAALAVTISVPMSLLYFYYLGGGSTFYLVLAGLLILLAVIAISFASYFLPATLLEHSTLTKSVKDSYSVSRDNSGLVTSLVFLSIIMLGAAFLSSGILEKLGYAGFLLGRMSSTVVNTYVFVMSPKIYYSAPESLN
ncbi:MAG: hypothetical protein ABEJ56_00740 [Candidatus Nanohaloarchaea archaeon]